MSEKILITGATGQLGTELSHLIPGAILTDLHELDITDATKVANFVFQNNIETIVNCAAYTAVDKAEDDIDAAYRVNTLGPSNLGKTRCKIIHISTDYVFDGQATSPYKTTDRPNPLSIYGKTKLMGEQELLKHTENIIIIRTAWLYSPYGNNFFKTMRRLGAGLNQINVVNDQIGTPTYAADLAQAITKIIPQISYKTRGVYHFTNEGECSWYDFAREIMRTSNLKCQVNPIPSSEYPTKAPRPKYSVLDKTKIKDVFDVKIAHWMDGLKRCTERAK